MDNGGSKGQGHLAVVCPSCSQVARISMPDRLDGDLTCPSCGVTRPLAKAIQGLPQGAVTAMAAQGPSRPRFSERFERTPPALPVTARLRKL